MKARTDTKLIRHLQELIAALDRRVPRLEHEAERTIARDAAALRSGAVKRLAELRRSIAAAVRGTHASR